MAAIGNVGVSLFLVLLTTSCAQSFDFPPEQTSWTDTFNLWLWGPPATVTIELSLNATDDDGDDTTVIHRLMSFVKPTVGSALVVNVEPLWESETSRFPTLGLDGILMKADPFHACIKVDHHPEEPMELEQNIYDVLQNSTKSRPQWILIAEEGYCSIALKMEHAQRAGYSALLILSADPKKVENMSEAKLIDVYAGKVSGLAGINLAQNYVYPEPVIAKLEDLRSAQWGVGVYKIVAIVVVILIILAAIVTIIVLIVKNMRKRREEREAILFREALQRAIETMPITVWELNQMTKDEKCHICYGLFYPNDVIRTLPCYHRFHQRCIISRFDNKNTECAVCHYQVLPPGIKIGKTTETTPLL